MSTIQQNRRRQHALQRLEIQLAKGHKKSRGNEIIELSNFDIDRIKKEIENLKSKV